MSTKLGPENNFIWELGVTELNLQQIWLRFPICVKWSCGLIPHARLTLCFFNSNIKICTGSYSAVQTVLCMCVHDLAWQWGQTLNVQGLSGAVIQFPPPHARWYCVLLFSIFKPVPPKRNLISVLVTLFCQTDRLCNRHNKKLPCVSVFVIECLSPFRVCYGIRSYKS